jgi:hypothetical protein
MRRRSWRSEWRDAGRGYVSWIVRSICQAAAVT